ncbi:MAG: ribosome biogenesis GTPase Der [Chlamydiales bacterium]
MFKLAIIGRPNVGKSSLFNKFCNKRIAIVDEVEGSTRDRLYGQANLFGMSFEVIDTGGIDLGSSDRFYDQIRKQAENAILEADTLIMVVDGQVGITEIDQSIARFLLKTGKPLTLAINKIDNLAEQDRLHRFYSLGISNIVPVSAVHGYQIAELLEIAWKGFSLTQESLIYHKDHIAIIGRTNVGKSTLVNALVNEERSLASSIRGTTRDSIDIPIQFDGKEYILIDTAGVRRKKSEHTAVEKFATIRTEGAIERCDLCLLVLDGSEGMTTQEKQIVQRIEKAGKSCIVLMNKWDLVKGFRSEHCLRALYQQVPFLSHCPVLFISAKYKNNLHRIFPQIETVIKASKYRVSTHQLNLFLKDTLAINPPPAIHGKRLRVYYMTQIAIQPPRFILFINHPSLISHSYKRYLTNQLRKKYGYLGTPLQLQLRSKAYQKK